MCIKRIEFRSKVEIRQAVFVIIYALDGKPYQNYHRADSEMKDRVVPMCMMLCRWDGNIGFIGGFVEEGDSFEDTVRKEVKEEVGYDLNFELEELVAHYTGAITTHAFTAEVPYHTLRDIYITAPSAEHLGSEVAGVFLPHLADYAIENLYQSSMAPSVREELTHFMISKNIFTEQDLRKITCKAGFSIDELLR